MTAAERLIVEAGAAAAALRSSERLFLALGLLNDTHEFVEAK